MLAMGAPPARMGVPEIGGAGAPNGVSSAWTSIKASEPSLPLDIKGRPCDPFHPCSIAWTTVRKFVQGGVLI